MEYFPLETPRANQTAVCNEVDRVIKAGKRLIILEGPVGCGKSGIAMTFARAFGDAHVITPRKSLQNQYYDDFSDDIVLMKGRSSYPCVFYETNPKTRERIIKNISEGSIRAPGPAEPHCGNGPCKNDKEVYMDCAGESGRGCPYNAAISVAQNHECIVHNLHSFIFQTAFTARFQKRELLVIDEAHEIETTLRDFLSRKITLNFPLEETDRPENITDVDAWCDFFLEPRFVPVVTDEERKWFEDSDKPAPDVEYIQGIEEFRNNKEFFGDKFAVRASLLYKGRGRQPDATNFEFIPDSLGNAADRLLFSLGEYVILMSGTIFDKNVFCRNLGVNPEDAHFIRISSTFPKVNRPIYLKPKYQVDTSHKEWVSNFNDMTMIIENIMAIFHDAKGLIHAPSYDAADQIVRALPANRVMGHNSQNLQEKLQEFYASEDPLVFVSPVCQQGVDFKGDRSRFQIITRVPYGNTNDPFINYKVTNDFAWYNYQALVVFGQMAGRVNRSEDDYGATFCLDSRFNRFVSRNSKILPKWMMDGMIWK